MSFGWSAGDIATAILLAAKVAKALKEAGGSSSEYQLLAQDLSSLQQVLELLKNIQPNPTTARHVNAIRGMALTCQKPLSDFLERIKTTYDKSLGLASTRSRIDPRGIGRKAQRGLSMKEDVMKLRLFISGKVVSIGPLVGILNTDAIWKLETQAASNVQEVLSGISESHASLGKALIRSDYQAEERHEELMLKAEETKGSLDQIKGAVDSAQARNELGLQTVLDACFCLQTSHGRLALLSKIRTRNISHRLENVERQQKETFKQPHITHDSATLRSMSLSFTILIELGQRLLELFTSFSTTGIDNLKQLLKTNMEIYELLLKLQQYLTKLPGGISSSLEDNVHFEDALGRKMSLQYDLVRHWEVFSSMLQCKFRDMPGESNILRGEYLIMPSHFPGTVIGKADWSKMVFPGSKLEMSIFLSKLRAPLGLCPRLKCSGQVEFADGDLPVVCPVCNITFFPTTRRDIYLTSGVENHDDAFLKGKPLLMDSVEPLTSRQERYREKRDILMLKRVHVQRIREIK